MQEETKACLMVQQCERACLCECVDIERAVVGKAMPEVLIQCVCVSVCKCVLPWPLFLSSKSLLLTANTQTQHSIVLELSVV